MIESHVYIKTDSSSPKKLEKQYGYVLESKIADKSYTREGFGEVDATYHQAVLTALVEALKRYKKPSEIHVHTEDMFVLNMLENNLSIWANNEFLNTKGKKVANHEEWQQIWEMSKEHLILTEPGAHEYSSWLVNEMKKRKEG